MRIDAMNLNEFIQDIQNNFPECLRPRDLIECGLFKSRSDVAVSMKRGDAPPSIRLGKSKVIFPRSGLCSWLRGKAALNDSIEAGNDKPTA